MVPIIIGALWLLFHFSIFCPHSTRLLRLPFCIITLQCERETGLETYELPKVAKYFPCLESKPLLFEVISLYGLHPTYMIIKIIMAEEFAVVMHWHYSRV